MAPRKKKIDEIVAPPSAPAAPIAVDVATIEDEVGEFDESSDARNARRPDVSHLDDALADVDGTLVPLFGIGDKIVIERTNILHPDRPWLDTQTYTVQDIDDVTGDLKLWNDGFQQFAASNFIQGIAYGYVFKLPSGTRIGKTRRGGGKRGRKVARVASSAPATPEPKVPLVTEAEVPVKRGRGRPPGSKNRPKAVIEAERRTKAKTASAKMTATQRRAEEKRAAKKAEKEALKKAAAKKKSKR